MNIRDERTKEGQERRVLLEIERHGGFSVFWATEHQKRAHAIERLQDSGRIARKGGAYPWCEYEIAGPEAAKRLADDVRVEWRVMHNA